MDTFQNTRETRPFVAKNFKHTLNRNDVFSMKLRHSQRNNKGEHGTSEIIYESNTKEQVFIALQCNRELSTSQIVRSMFCGI